MLATRDARDAKDALAKLPEYAFIARAESTLATANWHIALVLALPSRGGREREKEKIMFDRIA